MLGHMIGHMIGHITKTGVATKLMYVSLPTDDHLEVIQKYLKAVIKELASV